MTTGSDHAVRSFHSLRVLFGDTAGTYTQGAATKSIAQAILKPPRKGRDEGSQRDEEEATILMLGTDFASGFSGGASASITPSPGDTFTPAGETAWRAHTVRSIGQGGVYALDARRALQRGQTS